MHMTHGTWRISAGQVGINNNPLSGARSILSPFVGHKRSGYGSHSGRDGWRQFSTPKTLIYTSPPPEAALPTQAQPLPAAAAACPVAGLTDRISPLVAGLLATSLLLGVAAAGLARRRP